MPNKYSRYLEREESSRYTQELEGAQDKRRWLLPVAATAGLGLLFVGMRNFKGRNVLSRLAQPKGALDLGDTALGRSLVERHRLLRNYREELLAETRKIAGLKNLRLLIKDDTTFTALHEAIINVGRDKDFADFFLHPRRRAEEFAKAVIQKSPLPIDRLALEGATDKQKATFLRIYLEKSFIELSPAQRKQFAHRYKQMREIYNEELLKRFQRNRSRFAAALGLRPLTIGDLEKLNLDLGTFKPPGSSGLDTDRLLNLVKRNKDFEKMVIDPYLFINKTGQLVDFRKAAEKYGRFVEELKEFHLPFLGISPYDVLKIGYRRDQKRMPFLHIFKPGSPWFLETRKPMAGVVTGSFEQYALDTPRVFIGSKIVDFFEPSKVIEEGVVLAPGGYGIAARTMATISGLASGDRKRRFLGIGEQEGHSFWRSLKTIFTKFKDPEWAGNYIENIAKATEKGEIEEGLRKLHYFVRKETLPLPDDVFKKVVGGAGIDLSSREDILQAFEKLATSKDLSVRYGGIIKNEWRNYLDDPFGYLSKARSYHNKFADVGIILSQFSERQTISKIDDIKKLVQQELIEQAFIKDYGGDVRAMIDALLGASSSINTKGIALDFFLGRMHSGHGSLTAEQVKEALTSRSRIGRIADEFMKSRAPIFGYGNIEDTVVGKLGRQSKYIAIRKATRFTAQDLLAFFNENTKVRAAARERIRKTFAQFFAGRNSLEDFTEASMWTYYYGVGRMHDMFNFLGIGLPARDTTSTGAIFIKLLTKRYLPVALGIGYAGYLSWEMGNLIGIEGDEFLTNLVYGIKEDYARARDILGITEFAKRVRRVTPGSEYLEELPFLGPAFFQMHRSYDEVKEDRYKDVPIRKGRYWFVGSNTPFIGGKVDYYFPSAYVRARADYRMTDVLYGSESEYYQHTWFPTPRYPAAPLRHFVTDPYHWEKKHYRSRPYPETGPISALADIPIIGPILSATIGRILKPPKKMHQEEMAKAIVREHITSINEAEKEEARQKDELLYISPSGQVKVVYDAGPASVSRPVRGRGFKVVRDIVRGKAATQTESDIAAINEGIKKKAKDKTSALETRTLLPFYDYKKGTRYLSADEVKSTHSLEYTLAKSYYGLTEWAGLYGFLLEIVTGQPYEEMKIYQDSGRMTSANRWFWDLGLGGLGSEMSEMGRRFIPKPRRYQEELEYNPLRNDMPSWIPGENYFQNFKLGDPYAKIPRGEGRLPGAGYEALRGYDPMRMTLRASVMGKSEEEIMKYLLHVKEEETPQYLQDIMETGTEIHREIQKLWKKQGILHSDEGYVYDEEANITGHYDAIIRTKQGLKIVDIKTVSRKRYQELLERGKPFEEHIDQVTVYMHATGLNESGAILYVSRDPNLEPLMMEFKYDPKRYERIKSKAERVRKQIRALIDQGIISRYELYDPVHRFRILADVAPYSDEYKYWRDYVTREYSSLKGYTGQERKEREQVKRLIAETKRQVAERKKKHRFFPYRFKHIDIVKQKVKVTDVLGGGMFLTKEYPDTPISLAGIRVSSALGAKEQRKFLERYIKRGKKVYIGISKHDVKPLADGELRSVDAVVYARGHNVNLRMMRAGLAKEKEEDFSPAAVHARFTPLERAIGSLWESFAHMDTPIHTKLLPVRSPLEEYRRKDVYGKSFQTWSIKDQLIPTLESYAADSPVVAALSAGTLGLLVYGTTWKKRLIGFKVGATIGATLSLLRIINEGIKGEKWIPKRRRKEREINEYFDILEYIKYKGLYEYAKRKALEEEGFDVEEFYKKIRKKSGITRAKRYKLEEEKKKLIIEDLKKKHTNAEKYFDELSKLKEHRDKEIKKIKKRKWQKVERIKKRWERRREFAYQKWEEMEEESRRSKRDISKSITQKRDRQIEKIKKYYEKREAEARRQWQERIESLDFNNYFQPNPRISDINKELEELAQNKEVIALPDWAVKAIKYRERYESTLYGADSYGHVGKIMAALPSKEREYFAAFLQAKPEERKKILELVPKNIRRFLQASWGMEPEEKIDLEEYFKKHYLPPEDWEGWSETKNLSDIKVKVIHNEGLDLSEFGFWKNDLEMSKKHNAPNIPITKPNLNNDQVKEVLRKVLEGVGLQEVDVVVHESDTPGFDIDIQVEKDRRDDIVAYVNDNLDVLL